MSLGGVAAGGSLEHECYTAAGVIFGVRFGQGNKKASLAGGFFVCPTVDRLPDDDLNSSIDVSIA